MIRYIFLLGLMTVFISSCATGPQKYKPFGMISKNSEKEYVTTTYGKDEKSAMSKANSDAKGLCKQDHQTEYFKIVDQKTEDLNPEEKGGIGGAAVSIFKMSQNKEKEENNKVVLTFLCT